MRTLDKSRSFGQVFGMVRVRYWQDGVYFDASGQEVKDEADKAADVEAQPQPTREELEGMHWTKLKTLVNALDLEYSNKDEAIEAILERQA